MLDAAREALSFVEGRSRADLDRNRMLTLSLIAEIQIVGEAANKPSPELKESIASIPWSDVIGMRNRLIHAYADVNLDILWGTVKRALPPLIEELEALLAQA